MDRKEELLELYSGCDPAILKITTNMIDDAVFLEDKLTELRKLPFIRVHKKDTYLQKRTEAAKQYKELLPQYILVIKALSALIKPSTGNAEDPVLEWLKQYDEKP